MATLSQLAFTCDACRPPVEEDGFWKRCRPCQNAKNDWVQKKRLPREIARRVKDHSNLLLITLTTPNIMVDERDLRARLQVIREEHMAMVRQLTRSKKNGKKQETNKFRQLHKGWFYAFESVVKPLPDGPSWMVSVNAHIHMFAERTGWYQADELKELTSAVGFGNVNLKHVSKNTTTAVRYVVKYIAKDRREMYGDKSPRLVALERKRLGLKSRPRYYERGGIFRGKEA